MNYFSTVPIIYSLNSWSVFRGHKRVYMRRLSFTAT